MRTTGTQRGEILLGGIFNMDRTVSWCVSIFNFKRGSYRGADKVYWLLCCKEELGEVLPSGICNDHRTQSTQGNARCACSFQTSWTNMHTMPPQWQNNDCPKDEDVDAIAPLHYWSQRGRCQGQVLKRCGTTTTKTPCHGHVGKTKTGTLKMCSQNSKGATSIQLLRTTTETLSADSECLELSLIGWTDKLLGTSTFYRHSDALEKQRICPVARIGAALRLFAYGKSYHEIDELCNMSRTYARESFVSFVAEVIAVFEEEYLRMPRESDLPKILGINALRGFLECVGSLDC